MEWTGTVGDFTFASAPLAHPLVRLLKSVTNVTVPSFETATTQKETVVMQ
jgi:hypothetical protein